MFLLRLLLALVMASSLSSLYKRPKQALPTSVPAPGKDQPNRPAHAATSGRVRCMLCGDRPRATPAIMKRKVGGCKSHHSNVGIYTSILVSPQPEKLFHETIEVS